MRPRHLVRMAAVLFALGVIASGCGPADSEATLIPGVETSTTEAGTVAPGTTAPPPSSTLPGSVPPSTTSSLPPPPPTTTPATTTTAPAPTTTTTSAPVPVTTGANYPAALGRHLVPWASVADGWYLVLYDGSDAEAPFDERPVVLYLAAPDGTRYEVAAWPPGAGPVRLFDWKADGTQALVEFMETSPVQFTTRLLDLATGTEQHVLTVDEMESYRAPEERVMFTRPTGLNLVHYRNDGTTEWIERRSPAGALLATVAQQPSAGPNGALRWLYGPDGTNLVISDGAGLHLVGNNGVLIRDLWTPMSHVCDPVRWWDALTILASCRGLGPAFPHEFYHRLFLIPTDGTATAPLTDFPPGPIDVVEFGIADAWPTSSAIWLQWWGDCGAAHIRQRVTPTVWDPLPAVVGFNSHWLQGITGSEITVLSWEPCDEPASLVTIALDGSPIRALVPRTGIAQGVRGVVGRASVFP